MLNNLIFIVTVVISSMFLGCATTLPQAVKVEMSDKKIDFLQDVKPILDKRCVSCHSCYNSPCQAKFSSFEGVDRGGSKLLVYDALRFKAMQPTRLFIDAKSAEEWRKKGFYSLTQKFDNNESYNDSIMMHMLYDKKAHPKVIGSYKPESDKLTCPKNLQEMGEYLQDKPNHGMPYGMPAIEDAEYDTLAQWIARGAKGPTQEQQAKLVAPTKQAQMAIEKWEAFLNESDAKHVMTARYLYEHLFLAHISFADTQKEFYSMVRSSTPSPKKINEIASIRPFDDPEITKFYYRFQKIHSTIVFKTHMLVEFDDAKMDRIKELFIKPKWDETPHAMSYETNVSANPFLLFAQIPVKSRYQFLLDNARYIVMTFIRGPVCRGQIALNVIHDHFWVMFKDPESDISVLHPEFLLQEAQNLSMPIQTSAQKLLDIFSDDYRNKYREYFTHKEELTRHTFPNGQNVNDIWRGNGSDDSPLLTIYRHYDSASVHHGILGKLPKTMWVIDYPQFERIYYALVAGYDVFGNVSHQANIRRYMDFLRVEGELNFLTFMPQEKRLEMFKSWYVNDDDVEDLKTIPISDNNLSMKYLTKHPKSEFIEKLVNERVLKSTNIKFDYLNYFNESQKRPKTPKEFNNVQDVLNGARSISGAGIGFTKHVTGSGINNVIVKVTLEDNTSEVFTLVINRWHDNVNSMFNEEDSLNSNLDTIDVIKGSVGSYPNVFAIVKYKDLPDFFDVIKNFEDNDEYIKKLSKYWIQRGDKNFWKTYDWFQNDFNQEQKSEAGLYDLNRYYHR